MAVQPPYWQRHGTRVSGLYWDRGNRAKCRKHGVPTAAIEEFFRRPFAVFPDPAHSETEERFKAVGQGDEGRPILVVFTLRTRGDSLFIRPISARYMHAKEVTHYEEAVAEAEKRQGS
jgi:uncharacterized DUF497 family protein